MINDEQCIIGIAIASRLEDGTWIFSEHE